MKKPEPKPETGKSEPSMLSRMVSTLTGSSAKKKDEPKTAGAVVEKKATKDKATTGAASTPKATKERPKYVIVKPGDTLVTIARKYYGDGRHYKKIHEANKLKLKRGVWWIWPGQRLILP
jgi:nucleoid-associated protein YgaU